MNKAFYLAAGAILLLVAGLVHASGAYGDPSTGGDVSVSVSVETGAAYTHYCSYSYYYGYYSCQPYGTYATSYGSYCDPFDPFYSRYCYSPYYSSYGSYYPTYVVNPGTIVYANTGAAAGASQQPQGPACSDATPSGQCSSDYPKYCFNGQLINKATLCGCPVGQTQDPNNRNRCVVQTCTDGTALNTCSSSSKPQFCTANANLVDRPTQCGCPAGTGLQSGSCVPLNSACFVSTTASTIRAGESVSITVPYQDVQNPRGYVTCGNGQVASLSCNGGQSGTCVASCSYPSVSQTPQVVQAYVNGQLCSSSTTVATVSQLPTTGNSLVRVTDCTTGRTLPGSSIAVNGQTLVTNANGEASTASLNGGVQNVIVSKQGYTDAFATTIVTEGRTSILPICLNSDARQTCDVSVSLAGDITTNSVTNGVQLRIKNNLPEANVATVTYSSTVPIQGLPTAVSLLPGESKVVSVFPQPPASASSSSIASVTITGRGTCTSTVNLPLNLNGGVSVQSLTPIQSTHAGGQACFDFLLQNRGEPTEVDLSANSTGLSFSFDSDRFVIGKGESRSARLCATVPEGAVGSRTITVQGLTGANNVATNVQLDINSIMYSNVLGCFNVNTSRPQFVEVKLTNTGPSESFVSQLTQTLGFTPRLTQENLFNFVNQSTRSLFVEIDPSSMADLDAHSSLTVFTKDSHVKVFEQELCFQKPASFDSNVFLSPARVTVEQGKTSRAFVHIRNAGNTADTFEIVAVPPFDAVGLVSSRISLLPGQEKSVEVTLSPASNIPPATYLVPMDVYSLRDPAVRTRIASVNLVVDVTQSPVTLPLRMVLSQAPKIVFNQSISQIVLKVPVTNYEDDARTITPSLAGLPEGWSYVVSPAQVNLPRLTTTEFAFTINAKNIEAKDYNATVVLTDENGRQAIQTVVLPAKSSNWLTGFFVIGSTASILVGLVVILVLIGMYFLYKAWMTRQEIAKQEFALKR